MLLRSVIALGGDWGLMRVRRTFEGVAVAAAVLLAQGVLAGCSGGTQGHSAQASQHEKPSASAAIPARQLAALSAYRAMWNDLVHASLTADVNAPQLSDHASAGALQLLRYGLEQEQKEGVVSKGQPVLDPVVVSSQPTAQPVKYALRDCFDDTHWLQYTKSGKLKNDVPGGHHLTDATVELNDGTWKVTSLYLHEAGTC
ncbi:hypothetical protein NGB36_28350 [Streptomyces sp. RB6PN25]|uniref:Lipoprotein n=1 Tax=Streptomyces humicola TaxID=2953240 RepID=A0ABT1Q388_9ACTN|nr:hypothetical protein [Streptomyces humicola]MCQ4084387.1 hypothetical protein [Streptomyces humicola]